MKKATREQTKDHNYRLVLKVIYNEVTISRAEIARMTKLTPTTVSSLVEEMLEQGLVSEVGLGPSFGGKPPTLLSLAKDARQIIGIDLGNESFQGIVTNLRGEILDRANIQLEGRRGDEAVALVYQLVERLVNAVNRPLLGIGIGTPGIVESHSRQVRGAVNMGWWDLPLCDLLESRFKQPVLLINDSRAATLAEYTFNPTAGSESLVLIKAGNGISAGVMLNGEMLYGAHSGAGEIGHVMVVPNGELCRCGHYGCLETVASIPAILRQARQIARHNPDSQLNRLANDPAQITMEVVLQAHQLRDEAVTHLVTRAGEYLGLAAANVVGLVDVSRIVIAGSLSRFGEDLLQPLRRRMLEAAIEPIASQTAVEMSFLGSDIVPLGAATLLIREKLGLF